MCTELKIWKPTSPGQRGRITVDRSFLWAGPPFKALTEGLHNKGGRTASGRISVWHQGGGHKRLYRLIDFQRVGSQESKIVRIEYDPNRSARIALLQHQGPEWEGALAAWSCMSVALKHARLVVCLVGLYIARASSGRAPNTFEREGALAKLVVMHSGARIAQSSKHLA